MVLQCRAAVARGVNDLRIENITVDPTKAGEVRLKVHSNALCHTDVSHFVPQIAYSASCVLQLPLIMCRAPS